MNPVVHFEMPVGDKNRMANFYSKVFGWKMNMMGSEMGEYVVAITTESDEKSRRPTTPGAINGGFWIKDRSKPDQYPSVVIAVDDVKEHMKMIKEAGGEILREPDDIPGVGLYLSFRDTEGNRVGVLQPSQKMQLSP